MLNDYKYFFRFGRRHEKMENEEFNVNLLKFGDEGYSKDGDDVWNFRIKYLEVEMITRIVDWTSDPIHNNLLYHVIDRETKREYLVRTDNYYGNTGELLSIRNYIKNKK